jgi:hypothetical protein
LSHQLKAIRVNARGTQRSVFLRYYLIRRCLIVRRSTDCRSLIVLSFVDQEARMHILHARKKGRSPRTKSRTFSLKYSDYNFNQTGNYLLVPITPADHLSQPTVAPGPQPACVGVSQLTLKYVGELKNPPWTFSYGFVALIGGLASELDST